jgi:hypothetical protein
LYLSSQSSSRLPKASFCFFPGFVELVLADDLQLQTSQVVFDSLGLKQCCLHLLSAQVFLQELQCWIADFAGIFLFFIAT